MQKRTKQVMFYQVLFILVIVLCQAAVITALMILFWENM